MIFPLLDAIQLARGGKKDAFVTSLQTCDQLNFSTYLGGALQGPWQGHRYRPGR